MNDVLTKRDIARQVERPVDWVSGAAAAWQIPIQRVGKAHGIPRRYLKRFREAADAEKRLLAAAS